MNRRITAFVVAGGASRRMRAAGLGDKALLRTADGRSLLAIAVARLRGITGDVRILCGPERRYEDFAIPLVRDEVCGAGPLGGLHAALHATDAGTIVWLAVDLPRVSTLTLEALLVAPKPFRMAATTRGVEPLCAAFEAEPARDAVGASLRAGRLKITDALGAERIAEVSRPDDEFANVNEASDTRSLGLDAPPSVQFQW
jgi:molybdopterin-guanine dinucleotide biosynthesis protein A